MRLDPTAVEAIQAVSLGFAFAGLVASAFEMLAREQVSLGLLHGRTETALASVPVLVFCAPVVLVRAAASWGSVPSLVLGWAGAGACSLMSGRLVLDAVQAAVGL